MHGSLLCIVGLGGGSSTHLILFQFENNNNYFLLQQILVSTMVENRNVVIIYFRMDMIISGLHGAPVAAEHQKCSLFNPLYVWPANTLLLLLLFCCL